MTQNLFWMAPPVMGAQIVSLLKTPATELTGELVAALHVVLPHVPVDRGLLVTGEAAHLTPGGR